MSTPAVSQRVVLLTEPRAGREAKIRRYRLARLRLDEGRQPRFAHLKRQYD